MFLKFFGKKNEQNEGRGKGNKQVVDAAQGIDSEMAYCPECGDEYRDVKQKCMACGIALISGAEKISLAARKQETFNQRSMDIEPGDDLVPVRKGPLKDIKTMQRMLVEHRIPAMITGDENSCGKGCCGPEMFLQIKKEDSQLATELFASDFIKSTALDISDLTNADAVFDHQASETVCPACNCMFSPTVGACPDCGLCFE